MELSWLFYLCLMVVAYLYACVGHGGASGYIALMTLYELTPSFIRPTALILNIVVSLLSFVQFYRAGYFKWKLFFPFAILSIPASFVGGSLTINDHYFKFILGIILIFPILNLLGVFNSRESDIKQTLHLPVAIIIGGCIGFLSGLIGIGGGILLSPVLLLLQWASVKETAAVSALFIFVNSASGLLGQASEGVVFNNSMFLIMLVAIIGGIAGSYSGSFRFNAVVLKKVLALVLLVASVKLILI